MVFCVRKVIIAHENTLGAGRAPLDRDLISAKEICYVDFQNFFKNLKKFLKAISIMRKALSVMRKATIMPKAKSKSKSEAVEATKPSIFGKGPPSNSSEHPATHVPKATAKVLTEEDIEKTLKIKLTRPGDFKMPGKSYVPVFKHVQKNYECPTRLTLEPLRKIDKGARCGSSAPKKVHSRTQKRIDIVEYYAGLGMSLREIAALADVSLDVLNDYYRKHIEKGRAIANIAVHEALYAKCIEDRDVTAIKWWEATRCGLSSVNKLQITGGDGGPVEIVRIERVILNEERLINAPENSSLDDSAVDATVIEASPL